MQRVLGNQLRELPLMGQTIRIGTRGSKLALWQAEFVREALEKRHPGLTVELVTIKTKGDKILDVPLAKVGGKGLFVKEIEEALLEGRVDLAVHSSKDMPAEIPNGLRIGVFCEREDPRDALISRNGAPLAELPDDALVGTSSLRRSAQLKRAKPDIRISPLRGNLDTRLRKLESENLDAIILAAAGLKRLGLESRISGYLENSVMLPAVGQGALCIEIRENDPRISEIVSRLDHPETKAAVLCERAFLNRLEGGCQVPIAAFAKIEPGGKTILLDGLVADVDGTQIIRDTQTGPIGEPEDIGTRLAGNLLAKGADRILENLRNCV